MPCTIPSKCLHMRAGQAVHSRESFRGRLDGVSGTLGFPLERRVSLTLTTMMVAAVGVHRTLLHRLLGGCAFALAFQREVFASFDVSYSAAVTLLPSRRCRVSGALLDELLLVIGLAPLLRTNLHLRVALAAALRPSYRRPGSLLHDLAEEQGKRVRLDWKGEEPPSNTLAAKMITEFSPWWEEGWREPSWT